MTKPVKKVGEKDPQEVEEEGRYFAHILYLGIMVGVFGTVFLELLFNFVATH